MGLHLAEPAVEVLRKEGNSALNRTKILEFEEIIKNQPGHFEGNGMECPTNHHFAEGVYVREMFVPMDTVITGKIHNTEHVNILISGKMVVVTEEGQKVLTGPCTFVSPPGTKKVGWAVTDVLWMNVHPNPTNTRNLEIIEKKMVSDSFEQYQKAIKPSNFRRLLNILNP
jgi:hypothetical protein